jgi:uncharacterized protein
MERSAHETIIGLISDTHMPQRWKQIPEAVFVAFAGVDLIFHAGDVGELWTLDALSRIAPIAAVHGNDETDEATRALPYLLTLVAAGQRIVLTHGHYPDRDEEMAQRRFDEWEPKLARLVAFGKAHGASIVVFGHTHIPMCVEHDGVLLVNPGAIASGSLLARQKVQTVARLRLAAGSAPRVEFVNLRQPDVPVVPAFELADGFKAALAQVSELMLDDELAAEAEWLRHELYPAAPEFVVSLFLPLAHDC